MKKILFTFALLTLGMGASAQWISDLDEMALIGSWEVTSISGSFPMFKDDYHGEHPIRFEFRDWMPSSVVFQYNDGIEGGVQYVGFWIGGTTTGHYTLHLLSTNGWVTNGGYRMSGTTTINFWIQHFSNGYMTLSTYDEAGKMSLQKVDAAAVRSVPADTTATAKAYSLGGMELPTPDAAKGVVIQGGKKALR